MFAQKKKGFIPSPLPLAPKKIKRRFSFSAIKGSASLFPCLGKNQRWHCCHLAPDFCHHDKGEGRLVLTHLHILMGQSLDEILQSWQIL
ncbi:hypothetical protein [uncultured Helicobacter sp.]|uniref:hypothetical protein n=1 Tax=uncultured Helicobacter sp. TaxID=175537 RepID=UPI00374FE6AF